MVRSAGPQIARVVPPRALPGGRVTLEGRGLLPEGGGWPEVTVGGTAAHIVRASSTSVTFLVPPDAPGGRVPVRVEPAIGESVLLDVGQLLASGLHQVDNPVFDLDSTLYLTYSGARGEEAPVAIYRVPRGGVREAFVTGLTNATSLAFDPAGQLHVSSRFEGSVFRVDRTGETEVFASDLGVPCGLAFAPDGALLVGDRSGTIWKVEPNGDATMLAELPPSVAAFHLALAADGTLFVTGPTLSTYDAIYRIDPEGVVDTVTRAFGRPQGIAVGPDGALYVVEALASVAGVYRLRDDRPQPQLLVTGPNIVGLAFDPAGGWVVVSQDRAFRFDAVPEPA